MPDNVAQEKNSLDQNDLLERVRVFVRELLDDQVKPPGISFALTYVATELGLAVASNSVRVFPVVLSAVTQAAKSSPICVGRTVPEIDSKLWLFTNTTVH